MSNRRVAIGSEYNHYVGFFFFENSIMSLNENEIKFSNKKKSKGFFNDGKVINRSNNIYEEYLKLKINKVGL